MKDRPAQVRELLIEQYKDSPNLDVLIGAFATELQDVEVATDDLLNKRSIDTAMGVNLDIIGKIVVLERPYTDPDPEDIFTYENPDDIGGGFTDVPMTQVGGYFIGLNPQQNLRFTDSQYRYILRSKIIYNTADTTLENMHEYVRFVFGDDVEAVILSDIGIIDVNVSRPIGRQERLVSEKTFPIAAGVRLRYLSYSPEIGAFGFAGDDRNGGFGDLADPSIGGRFSTLVID